MFNLLVFVVCCCHIAVQCAVLNNATIFQSSPNATVRLKSATDATNFTFDPQVTSSKRNKSAVTLINSQNSSFVQNVDRATPTEESQQNSTLIKLIPENEISVYNQTTFIATSGIQNNAESVKPSRYPTKFSVDELLTMTFPKKTSNDTGMNPCKADVFVDDIAITFADSRKRYIQFIHRDPEDAQAKHKLISDSAKKILEKKKIWKSIPDQTAPQHKIIKRAAATTVKERLWDHGIIPYEIDESWSTFRKALAKQAMRHWENYTCLKFVERNKTENIDYVFFTERPCGCCSFVGKRGIGAQALSIGENCAKFGIVLHEIGHAIGYYHEHTRPDRDNYVQVFADNIVRGQETNFNKLPIDQVTSLGLEYDYDSIMHYARNTYSKNLFLDTIQPIGIPIGQKIPEIGQRNGLSTGDIKQTQILYSCPRHQKYTDQSEDFQVASVFRRESEAPKPGNICLQVGNISSCCFAGIIPAFVLKKCGQSFQTKSDSFASPPPNINAADDSTHCEWRISATPGEKIILNITSIDISKTPDCSKDYLEVRDGHWKKSKLLGKFCGRGEISEIKSDSSRMLVTYVSQNAKEHKGFTASFEVVCGGVLHVNSEGYLASPNYPDDYYPNKECTWKITVPEKYQVAIKFLAFDLEHQADCSYDYVAISDGFNMNSTYLRKYCGSTMPENVISTTNEMMVKFVSDRNNQKGGFSAKLIAEFNECEESDHGCEQLCVNTLGSFMCACNSGFELHSDKRSCVDACGGKFNATNGTVTSPSFPEFYPPDKRCTWEIETLPQHVIFLNFTHLDLEGNNYEQQVCEYDHVNVSSTLSNGRTKQHGSFCGTKVPKIITSEGNTLQLTFGSDDSIQQTGFAAVYFTDLDECATQNGGCEHDCTNTLGSFQCSCRTGFTLHENRKSCIEGDCVHEIFTPPYGSISSPNYPKYYPASKDCAWHLKTLPGHRVRLAFMNFNLEAHPECYFDYVQIFDGDSSKSAQIGRFCGPMGPHIITSSENQLYMTFKSDANVHKKGFWATYSTQCGGILQASIEKRKIYSHPKYGNNTYEPMTSCDWFVIGNTGYGIKLTFTSFDLENEEDCSYDYVEVFDGLDSGGTSFGKFCGNQTSQELTSSQEGLVIKFRTDDRIAGTGFLLEYEIVESIYSLEEYDSLLDE